jgi:hypothetical protein
MNPAESPQTFSCITVFCTFCTPPWCLPQIPSLRRHTFSVLYRDWISKLGNNNIPGSHWLLYCVAWSLPSQEMESIYPPLDSELSQRLLWPLDWSGSDTLECQKSDILKGCSFHFCALGKVSDYVWFLTTPRLPCMMTQSWGDPTWRQLPHQKQYSRLEASSGAPPCEWMESLWVK